jgi:hypothetical protein
MAAAPPLDLSKKRTVADPDPRSYQHVLAKYLATVSDTAGKYEAFSSLHPRWWMAPSKDRVAHCMVEVEHSDRKKQNSIVFCRKGCIVSGKVLTLAELCHIPDTYGQFTELCAVVAADLAAVMGVRPHPTIVPWRMAESIDAWISGSHITICEWYAYGFNGYTLFKGDATDTRPPCYSPDSPSFEPPVSPEY